MAVIHSRRGKVEPIYLIAAVILSAFVLFNSGKIKTYFYGYEPRHVPLIETSQLKSLKSSKPVFVYFYHKLADATPKGYFPVLDEFAVRYGDKVDFYRYLLNDNYQIEEFKNYWANQSTLVLFQDGREIKSQAAMLGDPRFLPRGFTFKFLKSSLISAHPKTAERKDWFLGPDDFERKIVQSLKPVLVNYTCDTCPAARMLEPAFRQIALENSDIADFYMVDTNDPKNIDILREYGTNATPTLALFNNGKRCFMKTGAYGNREPNEALILGMISDACY
jgi:thiol-disulfide isomerase/thioredoxin